MTLVMFSGVCPSLNPSIMPLLHSDFVEEGNIQQGWGPMLHSRTYGDKELLIIITDLPKEL